MRHASLTLEHQDSHAQVVQRRITYYEFCLQSDGTALGGQQTAEHTDLHEALQSIYERSRLAPSSLGGTESRNENTGIYRSVAGLT